MNTTVRLRGLRELIRAFRKIDKSLVKEVRDELKKAAEPVAATARSKVSQYRQASQRIRPRAAGASVFVRQEAGKVTGARGDFGALQMRKVLIPALEEHADELEDAVGDAIDRLANSAGF